METNDTISTAATHPPGVDDFARALELLGTGADLTAVLDQIARTIEDQFPGTRCSVMLTSVSGTTLFHAAGPSIPNPFARSCVAIPIAEGSGVCGTAAFRLARFTVTDTQSHPYTKVFASLSRQFELRSCVSEPIIGTDGKLLGTFAIYGPVAGQSPIADFRPLINATHLARVAIEKHARDAAAARARELAEFAQSCAASGLWDYDPATHRLEVSQSYRDLYGFSPHEPVDLDRWRSRVHPDDLAHAVRAQRDSIESDATDIHSEFRIVHPARGIRWISAIGRITRDAEGRAVRIAGINIDVTRLRQTERALAENQRRFESFAEAIHAVLYVLDLRTQAVVYTNPAFDEVFGRPRASLHQDRRLWQMCIHPDDRADIGERFDAFCRAGPDARFHAEYRILRPDGSVRWLRDSAVHVRGQDADSPSDTIVGIAEDITERKHDEARRAELEGRLRQHERLEGLGVLAGGVAHDFNNLLVGILGNIALAAQEVPRSSRAADLLRQAELAAQRAADLTRQLLAYAGKGSSAAQRIDLVTLAHEVVDYSRRAVSPLIRITIRAPRAAVPVHADPTQLRQVLSNLIQNAADALGAEPGAIEVAVDRADLAAADLEGMVGADRAAPGPYARLTVSDTGPGMSPDVASRVFDPFFTTKFTGRGLGLAATLGIVRGHGGVIGLKTSVGQGTAFTVAIPAPHAESDLSARDADPRSANVPPRATILVVDDEPLVLELIATSLEQAGFTVRRAASSSAALEDFAINAPDAVVMDLTMPGVPGASLLASIREVAPSLPVLVVSGYADAAVRTDERAGPTAFLPKPFSPDELVEAVWGVLQAAPRG